jgi:hypothetical protein
MWGRIIGLILLSPTMVWRSLNASMGMTFGELNVVPQNQTIVVWYCKKILKIIAKPKSFQNK